MNFNNRGNQQIYGTSCSIFGCLFAVILISFFVRGGINFFLSNFWLILVLGIVVWVFRKFIHSSNSKSSSNNENQKRGQNWQRDYENNKDTAYHNVERDFEEIDEDDE